MRIPKKMKIGGHIYKVEVVNLIDNDENIFGQCCADTNTIRLKKTSSQSTQDVAFIHEIFHVINCHVINWEVDEEKTEYLAQALYQTFSDNKLLK